MFLSSVPAELLAPFRILIFEDAGIIACPIVSRLEKSGYEIAGIAESSDETSVKEDIQTAVELRNRSDLPVIDLTAHGYESTICRAKRTPASAFPPKPIHSAAPATSIERAGYQHRADERVRCQRSGTAPDGADARELPRVRFLALVRNEILSQIKCLPAKNISFATRSAA
jgi:hypothetical protein